MVATHEKLPPRHQELVKEHVGGNVPGKSLRDAQASFSEHAADWLLANQTRVACYLIAALLVVHICIPGTQVWTSKFLGLSHYVPSAGLYAIGPDDISLIILCTVIIIGFRAAANEHVYKPAARHMGVLEAKDVPRFAEQCWLLTYSCVSLPTGLYLYLTSPYAFSMRHMWIDWPQRGINALTKQYMVAQLAFWTAQMIVLHIEPRRKDYPQMLSHHAITIALVGGAYAYHLYPAGNLILVLMDISDFFLPMAKCLRYIGKRTLCDMVFCVFLVSWFLTRHVLFLRVCWSLWVDPPRVSHGECFRGGIDTGIQGPFRPPSDGSWGHLLEPFTNPRGVVCFGPRVQGFFLAGLMGLQVLLLTWFAMILRIAQRVIRGNMAEDLRSDEEGDDDDRGESRVE